MGDRDRVHVGGTVPHRVPGESDRRSSAIMKVIKRYRYEIGVALAIVVAFIPVIIVVVIGHGEALLHGGP